MASVDTGNTGTNQVNDPNNPNNPLNQNGQTAPGTQGQNNNNQPQTSGGAGAVTSTGAANVTGQVVGTNAPQQPFQNIAQYLSANAPQSQQLAGQVANTVAQPIANAQNETNTDVGNFVNSVNAGYTPTNSALLTAVSQNPAAVVAENPQNVTNFQAQLNDTYTGPSDVTQSSDYSNLEANIAAAQANAANTATPAGIQTLLQGVEGPTTQGINNLDTVLLNNNPTNLATVQNAGQGASALTTNLNADTAAANAAASQAATAAPATATAAQDALAAAQANEAQNLAQEQNTIQGIVNEYNTSVGVIDPVMQNIASQLSTYLQQNPNISVNDAASLIQQLQTIAMPSEATYASPGDYANIAALGQLGDTNVGQLPINSSTANEAQTFNVPTALQNALGQAPGVEQNIQNELNTIGGDINTATTQFQNSENQVNTSVATLQSITGNGDPSIPVNANSFPTLTDPTTGTKVPATITQTVGTGKNATTQKVVNPAYTALQQQAQAAANSAQQGETAEQQEAPSLQWVNGADTGYQNLVNSINSDLGQLGTVGAPTLTYAPNTLTDPVTGAPIGQVVANAAPAASSLAALGGAGAAGTLTALGEAAGAGAAAGTVGAETADTIGTELGDLGEGLSTSGAPAVEAGTNAVPLSTGLTTFGQTLGPAAVAAYGASNIAQNSIANPVQSGLMTLANTGLSLATLSLPPQIFASIGKDINNVLSDIGNFFGGLF